MPIDQWTALLQNAAITDPRRASAQTRPRRPPRGTNKYIKGAPKNAKMSWSKVRRIRKLYFDEKWSVRQLCCEFELSDTAMKNIVSYQSWVPR